MDHVAQQTDEFLMERCVVQRRISNKQIDPGKHQPNCKDIYLGCNTGKETLPFGPEFMLQGLICFVE